MPSSDTSAAPERPDYRPGQLAMGIGALAVAAVMAWGALAIPSDAGYAGVGPDFLPWVVTVALAIVAVVMMMLGVDKTRHFKGPMAVRPREGGRTVHSKGQGGISFGEPSRAAAPASRQRAAGELACPPGKPGRWSRAVQPPG